MSGTEIKACTPSEFTKWAEFLDRNFGYQPPNSYAVDFAPLFEPDALTRSRLVWRDGAIASSATLYPVTAVTSAGSVKLAVIGAVATDEAFRGQGYSTQLLAELENLAQQNGADAIVLWSDKPEFYAKAGFKPGGMQEILSLHDLKRPEKLAPGTAVYGWTWNEVRTLYEAHSLRMERPDAYWRALESIKSCTRVQWIDDEGRVKAYLGFDRGKDLHGIVHEWGGEPTALHSLLWVVLRNRPNLLWLTHPKLADPIRPLLSSPPVSAGSLGLFKLLSKTLQLKTLNDVWFWGLDSL